MKVLNIVAMNSFSINIESAKHRIQGESHTVLMCMELTAWKLCGKPSMCGLMY